MWLAGGSDGKESVCISGDQGWIPGLGSFPGKGIGYPLQYSCLENLMDRGAGGLQFMGSQTVRHDRATVLSFSFIYTYIYTHTERNTVHP